MRVAIISDIHGNLPALESVLADCRRAGADQFICLGDIANLGPHPVECVQLVREACDVVLQGNHERYILGEIHAADWETCPTFGGLRWVRAQFSAQELDYLARLPLRHMACDRRAPGLYVHASPLSQFRGVYRDSSDVELAHMMQGVDGVTLFCGHTHIPLDRRWSDSRLVNVGAVGMPQDGNPLAKYVLATQRAGGWDVAFRAVPYDVEHLMMAFERRGLQAAGQVVTAVFRYQMLTGRPLAPSYLRGLEAHAAARGTTIGQVYRHYPVPAEVQAWVRPWP